MVVNLENHKFVMAKLFGTNVLYSERQVSLMDLNKYGQKFHRYELGYSDDEGVPVEVGLTYPRDHYYGTIISDEPLRFEIGDEYINKVGLKLGPGDFKKTNKTYIFPIWKKIRSAEWAKTESTK